MKNKRRSRRNTRVWPVVLAAAIITVIALAAVFGPDVIRYFKSKNVQNELRDMYRGASAGSAWDLILPAAIAEEADEPEAMVIHSDFADLLSQNPHTAGELTFGNDIHYPVVQYDNSFYLDHDFSGEPSIDGALFINAANQLSPRDSILLIHGHNMKSGAMFGDLDFYREYSHLKKHPIITFRTIYDAQDVYYVPVAAFDASMTPGAEGYFNIGKIRFDFDIPATETEKSRSSELDAYLAQMRALSYWTSPVEADSTDSYITLITCSYIHDNGRMMLLCRQLREGESVEGIKELFSNQ